jgi:hypothetical protein
MELQDVQSMMEQNFRDFINLLKTVVSINLFLNFFL